MTAQKIKKALFFVTKKEEGIRLDKLLNIHFDEYSRTYFHYLIEKGHILINSTIPKKSSTCKPKDKIEISFAPLPEICLHAENIPLDILFEDAHIIAINKPANMVVHPGAGNFSKTVVNALLFHCKNLPKTDNRPGIVHRLDKDTSGVLIAAKTIQAHQKLISLFQRREVKKKYIAICTGYPQNSDISAPIGRHPQKRKEMAILEKGKEATTKFQVLASTDKLTLVAAFPQTGRTHQIRVHLRHLNAPILGDPVYGNKKLNNYFQAPRQFLHAYILQFSHPITKKNLNLVAPFPQDFKEMLSLFFKSKINIKL